MIKQIRSKQKRKQRLFGIVVVSIISLIALVTCNACYWLFSDIQTRCVKKIAMGEETSLYDKASILSLHLGICTVGYLYCYDAARANFKMLVTDKDTIYMRSDKWLTSKIKARFQKHRLGRMAWNGNVDYAFSSPEKDGAILLNWCMLDVREINGKQCYVAECDYTWKQPSKTTFKITDKLAIVVYEQLFYELEKKGILRPFKLICYCEK